MHHNKRVSIILPAYNEEGNIKNAIKEFSAHPAVDEVIAVDNNSNDRTAEEIKKTKATYIFESTRGYGSALRRGLREATGDILVMTEPEGTYTAHDLDKLLLYGDEFDVVFCARTSRTLIGPGANMGFILRLGNLIVAKYLEYLFHGPSLTEVGCTYKLIHRDAYEKIKDKLTVTGSHFSPEFMIRVFQAKLRSVEIPIHYQRRIGTSKGTRNMWRVVVIGSRMVLFITAERIRSITNKN